MLYIVRAAQSQLVSYTGVQIFCEETPASQYSTMVLLTCVFLPNLSTEPSLGFLFLDILRKAALYHFLKITVEIWLG